MISDDMLCAAAARSCEIYVERCISCCDDSFQHTFSPQFERKIKKLKRRADHPVFYHAMYRAASILLAVLIATGAWLAVDTEARAAAFGWIKEIYGSFFVYRFEERAEGSAATNDYRPTWLPDGYAEFFSNETTESILIIYANEAGEMLKFNCIQNPSETDLLIDFSHMERATTNVGGYPADLLLSTSPDTANCILWTLPDNTAFYISAFLDESDLVRIAESVQKTEK